MATRNLMFGIRTSDGDQKQKFLGSTLWWDCRLGCDWINTLSCLLRLHESEKHIWAPCSDLCAVPALWVELKKTMFMCVHHIKFLSELLFFSQHYNHNFHWFPLCLETLYMLGLVRHIRLMQKIHHQMTKWGLTTAVISMIKTGANPDWQRRHDLSERANGPSICWRIVPQTLVCRNGGNAKSMQGLHEVYRHCFDKGHASLYWDISEDSS